MLKFGLLDPKLRNYLKIFKPNTALLSPSLHPRIVKKSVSTIVSVLSLLAILISLSQYCHFTARFNTTVFDDGAQAALSGYKERGTGLSLGLTVSMFGTLSIYIL